MNTLKRTVILLLFCSIIIKSNAQEKNEEQNFYIELGYSRFSTGFHIPDEKVFNLKLEGNYSVTNFFDLGLYFAYSPKNFKKGYPHALFYGFNSTIRPVSIFKKENNLRIKPFISAKFGGYSFYGLSFFNEGYNVDYSLSAGMNYHICKRFDLFSEYDIISKIATDRFLTRFRYGIVFKF